jgi:hypothetical protein
MSLSMRSDVGSGMWIQMLTVPGKRRQVGARRRHLKSVGEKSDGAGPPGHRTTTDPS